MINRAGQKNSSAIRSGKNYFLDQRSTSITSVQIAVNVNSKPDQFEIDTGSFHSTISEGKLKETSNVQINPTINEQLVIVIVQLSLTVKLILMLNVTTLMLVTHFSLLIVILCHYLVEICAVNLILKSFLVPINIVHMQLIKTCLQNTSRTYRLISSQVLKKLFISQLMKKVLLCFAKHAMFLHYRKFVKQELDPLCPTKSNYKNVQMRMGLSYCKRYEAALEFVVITHSLLTNA